MYVWLSMGVCVGVCVYVLVALSCDPSLVRYGGVGICVGVYERVWVRQYVYV